MDEKARYLQKIDPPDRSRWNRQMHCVRVFDELIQNLDRNLGNLLISRDWRVHTIDHTRAFRAQHRLRRPDNLVQCDRRLLQQLRALDQVKLHRELWPFLAEREIEALLARRDEIVRHYERLIAGQGERQVLFDLLPAR
jgi:hypothetical protein